MRELREFYEDKKILVTGGVGSVGLEICRKVITYNPRVLRILDNNETGLFDLEQELVSERIRTFVGDIRDKERLERAIEDVDIVFHAAALKHVPLCEYNPFEAAKTNVMGTQNLIEVAMDEEVEKFITISTDKAVNPLSVMGATKLLAERLTISANLYKGKRRTAFSCVRFGNVLDSRGSVVPVFRQQIKNGGPLKITDQDMTRFMISLPKAVELVLKVARMAQGEEIFILKMPAVRISDLGKVMIEELASKYGHDSSKIEIKTVGRRAREKLYEELMTTDEVMNAYENEEMFVVLPPSFDDTKMTHHKVSSDFEKTKVGVYSSKVAKLLTKEEIKSLINQSGIE